MAKKVTRAMKVEMFNAGKAGAKAGLPRAAVNLIADIQNARTEQQAQLKDAWLEGFDNVKGK